MRDQSLEPIPWLSIYGRDVYAVFWDQYFEATSIENLLRRQHDTSNLFSLRSLAQAGVFGGESNTFAFNLEFL